MTKQLSSAAKAVLDAATEAQHGSCYTQFERISSAALRAAATAIAVEYSHLSTDGEFFSALRKVAQIADELETQ